MKLRATVICERDSEVLFVRKPQAKWSLPGGRLKSGEAFAEAAVRELQEETGLNTEQVLYVFEFDAGRTLHHVFEAAVPYAERAVAQNEIEDCVWYSLHDVQDLDMSEATKTIIKLFLRRL